MGGKARTTAKLTLGPVLFHWDPERWRDFYFRVADEAPVDTVCVGEVVCAKRAGFYLPHLPDVIERLARAGKEVVHSTPILVAEERDLATLREAAQEGSLPVEANDVAGLALLGGRRHFVGPFVNVYNEGTLAWLARRGAERVCLPVELPAGALAALAACRAAELEVLVFGRMPLAISSRCYHARAHGRSKAACQYACAEDPDGMALATLDGEPFLAVNGVQTLSHAYLDLTGELAALCGMGITRFRLSPHGCDMVAVARAFRDVLDGRAAPAPARERLARVCGPVRFCNGYFHGRPGDAAVHAG